MSGRIIPPRRAAFQRFAAAVWLGCWLASAGSVFAEEEPEAVADQVSQGIFLSRTGMLIGGTIALALVAAAILLPLMMWDRIKAWVHIRQTRKDLAALGAKFPWFQWKSLRDRINQTVRKLAEAHNNGDYSPVAKFMTAEHFEERQRELKTWVGEGKQIAYRLNKLRKVVPLAIGVEDERNPSWVRALVVVDLVDYMRDHYTLEVVHGDLQRQNGVGTVWHFVHDGKHWVAAGIDDAKTAQVWALTKNRLDTTFLDYKLSKQRQLQQQAQEEGSETAAAGTASKAAGSKPPAG